MQIPEEFSSSAALRYVVSKGWNWKPVDKERVELEKCPVCKKTGYGHFYMITDGQGQDGLWMCHHCGKSSNLTGLKTMQGDSIRGIETVGTKSDKQETMPELQPMIDSLLADADVLTYLMETRGWSLETIKSVRLGLTERKFRKAGVTKALVYPYMIGDNCTFMHFRTLPPKDKEFNSLGGWDAALYNEGALRDGTKEIILVEGEPDTISLLQAGIEGVCGVPGASLKKAMWISRLDELEIERVYICYDNDKAGRKGAQELASRIGINRCYKITLPSFTVPDGEGTKPGKDINEWFRFGGGTAEGFRKLCETAPKFDVSGVTGLQEGLENLREKILGNGLMPKYDFPWPELSKKVGMDEGDICDITAPEKIGKTTFALNCLEYWVDRYEEDGLFICMEMTNERLIRKWVSHVASVADKITEDPKEIAELTQKFLDGIKHAMDKHNKRPGNIYFCYPTGISSPEDMYNLMVDCVRRYGVKWIVLDNLHLLAGKTLKGDSKAIHLDKISKNLASIAKEYNVQMIRILQPHRITGDGVCTTDNIEGSSQIAKDCDCSIVLNRGRMSSTTKSSLKEEFVVPDEETTFMRKMIVTVGLSRYSGGGEIALDYVGETSTIQPYNAMNIKMEETQKKGKKYAEVGEHGKNTTDTNGSADV